MTMKKAHNQQPGGHQVASWVRVVTVAAFGALRAHFGDNPEGDTLAVGGSMEKVKDRTS